MSTNQGRGPGLTVRPPADLLQQAGTVLTERGLERQALVVACLAALVADPDGFLAVLQPHWPPPARRGRPPARAADDAH